MALIKQAALLSNLAAERRPASLTHRQAFMPTAPSSRAGHHARQKDV
jgi:hypothetical protein